MINPYEKMFAEWYESEKDDTGNWSFDTEDAAKAAFYFGVKCSYEPMKTILYDVASAMNIKVVSKKDGKSYIAMIDNDGDTTKGAIAESPTVAIYKLINAIATKQKFTNIDDLSDDDIDKLGL